MKVLKYVGFGLLGVGFVFLAIFVTMSLWNWLIPSLFNGPSLSFWQTAGLFLLSKILLTGVAPGGHSRKPGSDWQRRYHDKYRDCCEESVENQQPVTSNQ